MGKIFSLALFVFCALAPSKGIAGNALFPETGLLKGQGIQSLAQKYSLWMQGDGNLVMYRADGSVRWASRAKGDFVVMQSDGNLVEYGGGYPVFYTHTSGHPGATLVIQDDGNLVIYAAYGQGPLWSI